MTQRIDEQVLVISPVEPEAHFIKIRGKMLCAEFVPRSHNAPLEKRESVFNRVRMNIYALLFKTSVSLEIRSTTSHLTTPPTTTAAMATNVLEVAAGSVTFKFYYPDTTSTYPTQSSVSATEDASTRRTSSGPYHLAAASQTSYDSAPPTGSSQTGYVPGVAFSTYVLKGTNTSTAASDDGNNPTNISSTPVM